MGLDSSVVVGRLVLLGCFGAAVKFQKIFSVRHLEQGLVYDVVTGKHYQVDEEAYTLSNWGPYISSH